MLITATSQKILFNNKNYNQLVKIPIIFFDIYMKMFKNKF